MRVQAHLAHLLLRNLVVLVLAHLAQVPLPVDPALLLVLHLALVLHLQVLVLHLQVLLHLA